nr:hypothetical protein [Pandoravirus belohorizontensis]
MTAPPVGRTITPVTATAALPIRPSTALAQRPPAGKTSGQPPAQARPPVQQPQRQQTRPAPTPRTIVPVSAAAPPKPAQSPVVAHAQQRAVPTAPSAAPLVASPSHSARPLVAPSDVAHRQAPPAPRPTPFVVAPLDAANVLPAGGATVADAAPTRKPVPAAAASTPERPHPSPPPPRPLVTTPTSPPPAHLTAPQRPPTHVIEVDAPLPDSADIPNGTDGVAVPSDRSPFHGMTSAAPAIPKQLSTTSSAPSPSPPDPHTTAHDSASVTTETTTTTTTSLTCAPASPPARHTVPPREGKSGSDLDGIQPSALGVAIDAVDEDGTNTDGAETECDAARHAKRRRTSTDDAMDHGACEDTTCDGRHALDGMSLVPRANHERTAAVALPSSSLCDSDPAPEPADRVWAQDDDDDAGDCAESPGQTVCPRSRDQRDAETVSAECALGKADADAAAGRASQSLQRETTQKRGALARDAPVYPPPPPDERRAGHRRSPGGGGAQVSPCGRVIDRPMAHEITMRGPWKLPVDNDPEGATDTDDGNPTRTAVRFWLTRPVETVRVVGAPCEFCLSVDGAVIEPHSVGGLLEMGDVCDADCRPSRWPAGATGERLYRALSIVRRARIRGQAIAPGVLDLTGIETALVFRGRLDRDTLDRMVVRFGTYNVWRECRSADGKTVTSGQWLYGS